MFSVYLLKSVTVSSTLSLYGVVELENRLLSRFDAASQRRDLSTMSECAKILSQVNTLFCSMRLYNSVGNPF